MVGVAAANAASSDVLVAGVAGLVAGAMSMAAGEYVSVSSQADTEKADLNRERKELATDSEFERDELAAIYVRRGLEPALAKQVAEQLMARDPLTAHARDELGITDTSTARPVQAALASAGTFALGAAVPLLTVLFVSTSKVIPTVIGTSILLLALLGGFGAHAGGAPVAKAALRVTFWGGACHGANGRSGCFIRSCRMKRRVGTQNHLSKRGLIHPCLSEAETDQYLRAFRGAYRLAINLGGVCCFSKNRGL